MQELIIYSFLSINFLSFFLMKIDKKKALKNQRRISEQSFFLISMLGGFFGILVSGKLFRHKTQKKSFQIKIFIAMILYIILVYGILMIQA